MGFTGELYEEGFSSENIYVFQVITEEKGNKHYVSCKNNLTDQWWCNKLKSIS